MLPSTRRRTRKPPHLYRNRLGTFYFRITAGGQTIERSLRTKDPDLATMRASKLNWEWLMKQRADEPTADEIIAAFKIGDPRQFDVVLPGGSATEMADFTVDRHTARVLREHGNE
jgi:hypothetical protein